MPPKTMALGLENAPPLKEAVVLNVTGSAFAATLATAIRTITAAIVNSGFKKAFYPIFDAHVTAIISSLFLFWFGSGPIKGFAVTLITGIVSSLFTAIWVSKLIFELVLSRKRKVQTISI